MILCTDTNLIFDSLGWIDKGAIWTFDLDRRIEGRVDVPGAQYVTLKAGKAGYIRVVHHMSEATTVSVRHMESPHEELASLQFRGDVARFHGRSELWAQVESAVLQVRKTGYRLFFIDPLGPKTVDLDLSWYIPENYDLGYQGLVDCMTLPDNRRVVVSVQRSSDLVILDKNRNGFVGNTRLPGFLGNPDLAIRSSADFLASDYDTLARVDAETLEVLGSARLQDAASGARLFIGNYYLQSESNCAVARPYSGDALLIDPTDFRILGRASLEGEPLSICMISESRVVTRDWKTGAVRFGEFRPVNGAA